MKSRLPLILLLMGLPAWCIALDSDQDQPATLEANDFELDLKTGVRTYRGDVVYRQGSIRLDCDELVTYFNDDGELDKALCTGGPGRFKQRPQDSEDDMIAVAREITMDQLQEIVVLKSRASATQGNNTVTGRLITYNLATEKVIVKGDSKVTQTGKAAPEEESGEQAKATEGDGDSGEQTAEAASTDSGRAKLVIQPRKKKKKN